MPGSQCHVHKGVGSRGCGDKHAANHSKLPSQEGSLWTCKPVVGASKGRYARASAAQFLAYNSAATRFFIALSMHMDGELKKEQIGTLFVGRGAVFGGKGEVGGPFGAPAENFDMTSTVTTSRSKITLFDAAGGVWNGDKRWWKARFRQQLIKHEYPNVELMVLLGQRKLCRCQLGYTYAGGMQETPVWGSPRKPSVKM
eukprot:1161839-Pelagomonas_calceolata.AAC.5